MRLTRPRKSKFLDSSDVCVCNNVPVTMSESVNDCSDFSCWNVIAPTLHKTLYENSGQQSLKMLTFHFLKLETESN